MNPFPGPRSILGMDNASIHKPKQLVQIDVYLYVSGDVGRSGSEGGGGSGGSG